MAGEYLLDPSIAFLSASLNTHPFRTERGEGADYIAKQWSVYDSRGSSKQRFCFEWATKNGGDTTLGSGILVHIPVPSKCSESDLIWSVMWINFNQMHKVLLMQTVYKSSRTMRALKVRAAVLWYFIFTRMADHASHKHCNHSLWPRRRREEWRAIFGA